MNNQKIVFKEDIILRIKAIHKLSSEYNASESKVHEDKLLYLMRKHIDEIENLRAKGEQHYLIETGDLIILCFELLIENGYSLDDTIIKCFSRYENKLNNLIRGK